LIVYIAVTLLFQTVKSGFIPQQYAVGDSRLSLQWHHLANSTKHDFVMLSDVRLVLPHGRLSKTYSSSLILLFCMKTWCHLQNWKYT